MSKTTNIFKVVVKTMHAILKVAIEKLDDNDSVDEILHFLGHERTATYTVSSEAQNSMANIAQFIELDDTEITLENFADIIDDILVVTNTIDDFFHLLSSDTPTEAINEAMDMYFQLCLLASLQNRSNPIAQKVTSIMRLMLLLAELPVAYPAAGTVGMLSGTYFFLKRLIQSAGQDNKIWAKPTEDIWADMSDAEWDATWQGLAPEVKEKLANKQIRNFSDGMYFLMVAGLYFVEPVSSRMKVTYGFDPPKEDTDEPDESTITIGDQISARALTFSMAYKPIDNAELETEITYIVSMALRSALHGPGVGLELALAGQGDLEFNLGAGWKASLSLQGIPGVDAKLSIMLQKESADINEEDMTVWGASKGMHLAFGKILLTFTAGVVDKDVDIRMSLKDCAFFLSRDGTDGFIQSIIPKKGIEAAFDFGIGYSYKRGWYVDGGSGISVFIPLHKEFGPILFDGLYLKGSGDPSGDGFLLETSVGFTTDIMGIKASIQQIGLLSRFTTPDGKRNLYFADGSVSFKPPTMIGLSIDIGGFKGGGFIAYDAANKEYTGAIELSYDNITLKAIAIITTQDTADGPDYSMLIIITAEFTPRKTGPFFTLLGVGGMFGIHRMANIDTLREGIKTNSLKSILFPENIVANIARIVSDLKQVFPPQKGHLLICPMVKVGWGPESIVTIDAGLLIEIPEPRLAIFGVVRAKFPDKDKPILILQVNFLGVIDLGKKTLSFDASLYDSSLLTLTLSGDFALRVSWGDPFTFLISVGGFHPDFNKDEIPEELRSMQRLTVSLLSGENPRATLQCYFAVTSNTVQFGARAELYARASAFNVYGYVGFDVIFRSLGSFEADFEASLALRRNSDVLMGITVSGTLAGTEPWNLKGKGSISFFFFSISVPFHVIWGAVRAVIEPLVEDLFELLTVEIARDSNWVATMPSMNSLHVTVRKIESQAGKLVIHPFGILTFSQSVLPLNIDVDKFGNKVPKDTRYFEIKIKNLSLPNVPVKDQFAPGNFLNMEDAEKLSRPSYERLNSGFKITGSSTLKSPQVVNKSVVYEFSYLGRKKPALPFRDKYEYNKGLFKSNTRTASISKSSLSNTINRISLNAPVAVPVLEEQYAIAHMSDLKVFETGFTAGSYTEAMQAYNDLIREQPALREKLQVIAAYELNYN